jgi:fructokinase
VTLFGAVEIGGTKTDLAVGTSPDDMSTPLRIPTTAPGETLESVVDFFRSHPIDAVGVACFGPLERDRSSDRYGTMLSTPKPGWTGISVYDHLTGGIAVPVTIDTDVNGAAIGEGRWGAAVGMTDFAYVTVGTGIGAGIVVNGGVIGGRQHPEMGHIVVSRRVGDTHEGSCSYHRDCLEGMASGPALESRFGRPETWAGNEAVVGLCAHYLAQGLLNLVYTVGPERIIVGGGVSAIPWLHERVRERLETLISGYPSVPDLDLLVSKPGLGELSGLAGALALAGGGVA